MVCAPAGLDGAAPKSTAGGRVISPSLVTLKFGFDYEGNDVFNLFLQDLYGNYSFASIADFNNLRYSNYSLQQPRNGDINSVAANFEVNTTGVFLQDTWAVAPNLPANLKALEERLEVSNMLARVEGLSLAEYDILPADPKAPLVGRLVQTGILDELSDRKHVVLENAGGSVTTLDGSPLRYGKPGFENPHFVAQGWA